MAPAAADEPWQGQPDNLPHCTKYKLADGTTVCGYKDLADWQVVLKADAELTAKRSLLDLERQRALDLAGIASNLQGQVEAFKRIVAEQSSRNAVLTADLLETDRKYQLERVKPKWGNPIAWTTAAIATAVLGGYVLSDVF